MNKQTFQQSQCPKLNQFGPDQINFSQKNFHILIIFHQQCKNLHQCFFFLHYLTLSFTVIHILNATRNNSFELNKNVILKTFDSNVQGLF